MIANTPGASVAARARLILTAMTAFLAWGSAPAAAQDCGATIGPGEPGVEVFLDGDIGPCDTDPALTIEGPVTVNLNGFVVSCLVPAAGEGFAGIEIVGFNAWVRNGVVEDCEDGVILDGRPDGGRHVVTRLRVRSTQQEVGNRGLRVRSDGNHLIDNRANRFSGVGFRVDGSDNRLIDNLAFGKCGRGLSDRSGGAEQHADRQPGQKQWGHRQRSRNPHPRGWQRAYRQQLHPQLRRWHPA